jgi:hypothetical protein
VLYEFGLLHSRISRKLLINNTSYCKGFLFHLIEIIVRITNSIAVEDPSDFDIMIS